jgi:hypothetical protein
MVDQKASIEKREAPAGATMLVGAPAKPMPPDRHNRLYDAVRRCPDVLFAYVPQVYIPASMQRPAQALFLVLRDSARGRPDEAMQAILPKLRYIWPEGEHIDVFPIFRDNSMLPTIIMSGMLLAINDEFAHAECIEAARPASTQK